MFRITFGIAFRGLAFCVCVLLFVGLVLPPSSVRGSGFASCAATIYDKVLSALGLADGAPASTRVNESGALWMVDSDLADTILGSLVLLSEGSETARLLEKGTRHFQLRLMIPDGSTLTCRWGVISGVRNGYLTAARPYRSGDHLDIPELGTTLFFQPGLGAGGAYVGVVREISQNPD